MVDLWSDVCDVNRLFSINISRIITAMHPWKPQLYVCFFGVGNFPKCIERKLWVFGIWGWVFSYNLQGIQEPSTNGSRVLREAPIKYREYVPGESEAHDPVDFRRQNDLGY